MTSETTTDYSALAPKFTTLTYEQTQDILANAPFDTVLQATFYGESRLYVRYGAWRALEELVTEGPDYLTYETWATLRDDELERMGSEDVPTVLVRWGNK